MTRILVVPERIRSLSAQLQQAAQDLAGLSNQASGAWSGLDWEARQKAGAEGQVNEVRGRAQTLAGQAEAMARYLASKAQAFEEADQQGAAGLPTVPPTSLLAPIPTPVPTPAPPPRPWPYPTFPIVSIPVIWLRGILTWDTFINLLNALKFAADAGKCLLYAVWQMAPVLVALPPPYGQMAAEMFTKLPPPPLSDVSEACADAANQIIPIISSETHR